jgi:cyclomaltodextrinase
MKFIKCLSGLIAFSVFFLCACQINSDINSAGNSDTQTILIKSVQLDASSKIIAKGSSFTLTASYTPSDAANTTLIWSSGDASVASVKAVTNTTATVTGISEGQTAIITVRSADDNKSATCSVTVAPIAVITFSSSSGTTKLSKLVSSVIEESPQPAAYSGYIFSGWYTEDTFINKVSFPYTVTGDTVFYAKWISTGVSAEVTFDSQGGSSVDSVTVNTGTSIDAPGNPVYEGFTFGGWFTDSACSDGSQISFPYTVTESITLYAKWSTTTIPVTGISLDTSSAILSQGSTKTLTATVTPSNATNKTVTWISDTPAVATVSNGVVTAVSTGSSSDATATISAVTADGLLTASCIITVSKAVVAVTGISVSPAELSLTTGTGGDITAALTPADAADQNIIWTTSDASVATVTGSGLTASVTAVSAGTASITATSEDGSFSDTCAVTVADPDTSFKYIRIVAAKSLNYNHIYSWTKSNSVTTEYTGAWPGSAMNSGDGTAVHGRTVSADDYYYDFDLDAVNVLVTDSSRGKLCSSDMAAAARGIYRVTSSGISDITTQPPVISISPSSGTVSTTGTITITVSSAYDLTSASAVIYGTTEALSLGTNTFSVSDFTTESGKTITVSATASNQEGTGTASAVYTTSAVTLTGDFNELRIYQVMVSSFQDGDSSIGYTAAYGPSGALTGGDLQGIINAIPYIKSLGMNAIWMTPVFNSNASDSDRLGSTGYYTYDYFNVDPHFGTNALLKTLIDTAHANGLYVILDGVFGHWGASVASSPNGLTPTRSYGQYKGCNYPASLEFYEEVAKYWITNYGIDGWRLDQCYQAGVYGDGCYTGGHNYWYEIRQAVEAAAASRKSAGETWGTLGYMVGECWDGSASVIQAEVVAPGSASGYGLRSCFDFPSRYSIVNTLAKGESDSGGNALGSSAAYVLETSSEKGYYHPDGYYPNVFISNHDLVRFGNLLNWKYSITPDSGDSYWGRHKIALSILAAYSGPVTVYYGDEWGAYVDGYTGAGALGAYNDNAARSTGKISGFSTNEQSLHDFAAKLMEAKAGNKALWEGTTTTLESGTSFYACKKVYGTNTVVVLMNSGSSAVSYSVGSTGTDLINGGTTGTSVSVPAYSSVFIRLD